MEGTNRAGSIRLDAADRQRPHLAAEALAAIHEQSANCVDKSVVDQVGAPGQLTAVEDAGPVLICEAEENPDVLAVEYQLQRTLMNLPRVTFSSLSVQRIADGICLQGILEYNGMMPDVCELARQVAGVENVLNQLVTRPVDSPDTRQPDH